MAVIAPNLPALLLAHYAVPAAGAVLVPLNPRLSTRELDYILDHSEASVVIADSSVLDTVISALDGKEGITLVQLPDEQAGIEPVRDHSYGEIPTFDEFIDVEPLEVGDAASSSGERGVSYKVADENSPITLNYTSGTTGRPKGVLYGHRGAYLNSLGEVFHNGFDGATRYLWTLPMFHCNGWCTTWAVTAAGGTHVCLRAVRPDAIWDAFDNQGITHLCGAPAVCSIIVDADEAHSLDNPIRITTRELRRRRASSSAWRTPDSASCTCTGSLRSSAPSPFANRKRRGRTFRRRIVLSRCHVRVWAWCRRNPHGSWTPK